MSRIALIEDQLHDAIAIELSVDETAPGKARFELKQNLGVTDAQWETDTSQNHIKGNAAEFMDAFRLVAHARGYRLSPEDGGPSPNLACETFITEGKDPQQVQADFLKIIRETKSQLAAARLGHSPNSVSYRT